MKAWMRFLEVLRDARVALLGEDGGVLDAGVPPRRHVSDDGLLPGWVGAVIVRTGRVIKLVVGVVGRIFLRVVDGYGVVARVI